MDVGTGYTIFKEERTKKVRNASSDYSRTVKVLWSNERTNQTLGRAGHDILRREGRQECDGASYQRLFGIDANALSGWTGKFCEYAVIVIMCRI